MYTPYGSHTYYIKSEIFKASNRRTLVQVIGYYVVNKLCVLGCQGALTVKYINKSYDPYKILEVKTLDTERTMVSKRQYGLMKMIEERDKNE